jgi:hypothetical protein
MIQPGQELGIWMIFVVEAFGVAPGQQSSLCRQSRSRGTDISGVRLVLRGNLNGTGAVFCRWLRGGRCRTFHRG